MLINTLLVYNLQALITKTAAEIQIDGSGLSSWGEKTFVKTLVQMSPRVLINHI